MAIHNEEPGVPYFHPGILYRMDPYIPYKLFEVIYGKKEQSQPAAQFTF
jgi:hypothetical protein